MKTETAQLLLIDTVHVRLIINRAVLAFSLNLFTHYVSRLLTLIERLFPSNDK